MAERDNFVVRDISRCMRELQAELEIIQVPLTTFCRCPETGLGEMPNRGTSGIVSGSDITRRRHRRVINLSVRLASFI